MALDNLTPDRFQQVIINMSAERTAILCDTVIRVSDKFALAMHIDTDESNAVGAGREQYGEIVKL